jgi:hypothetical protein
VDGVAKYFERLVDVLRASLTIVLELFCQSGMNAA